MQSKGSSHSKKSGTSSSHIVASKRVKAASSGSNRHKSPLVQSQLTVNIARDLLDVDGGGSDTGSNASSNTRRSSRRRGNKTTPSQPRPSPSPNRKVRARRERVFIPGERSSPRKRKGHENAKEKGTGMGAEKQVQSDGKEKSHDPNDSSVELDDDTFKQVGIPDFEPWEGVTVWYITV